LQIDDVDTITRAKDVGFHLGVPPFGLVTKMNPRFKQFLHCYISHRLFLSFGLAFAFFFPQHDFH
jgi:hypothetical protein